jgi:hypothetical protein
MKGRNSHLAKQAEVQLALLGDHLAKPGSDEDRTSRDPKDGVTKGFENEVLLLGAVVDDPAEDVGLGEHPRNTATGGGSGCYCLTFALLPLPPFSEVCELAARLPSVAAAASMWEEQGAMGGTIVATP